MSAPVLLGSGLRKMYLGTAQDMTALPAPLPPDQPLSRGGGVTDLISGGRSGYQFPAVRSAPTYEWDNLDPDDAAAILAFWDGSRGPGPWMLVDPAYRNYADLDISNFGVRWSSSIGWSVGANCSTAPNTNIPPAMGRSGISVLTATDQSTAWMFEGVHSLVGGVDAWTPAVDTVNAAGTAVPRIIDQPQVVSVWAKLAVGSSAVSATMSMPALQAAGAVSAGAPADDSTLGTNTTAITSVSTWQQLWRCIPAGVAADDYVTGFLKLSFTNPGPAKVRFSCFMHEIGVTSPSNWVQGYAVPRVICVGDNPVSSTMWPLKSVQLPLQQI